MARLKLFKMKDDLTWQNRESILVDFLNWRGMLLLAPYSPFIIVRCLELKIIYVTNADKEHYCFDLCQWKNIYITEIPSIKNFRLNNKISQLVFIRKTSQLRHHEENSILEPSQPWNHEIFEGLLVPKVSSQISEKNILRSEK